MNDHEVSNREIARSGEERCWKQGGIEVSEIRVLHFESMKSAVVHESGSSTSPQI